MIKYIHIFYLNKFLLALLFQLSSANCLGKFYVKKIDLKNSKASHESIGRLEYKLFGYRYNRHIDSTVKLRPINNQRGIASVHSSTSIKKGSRVITGDYTIKLKPKSEN